MGCLGCLGRVEPNEGSNHRKWPRLELFTQTFAQKDSVFEESLNTRQCDGKCFSPTQNENVERSSLSLNSELAVQDVIQESVPLGESWCIRGGALVCFLAPSICKQKIWLGECVAVGLQCCWACPLPQ